MEARVLATSSESRLSTSLGDLGSIIKMVAMWMMIIDLDKMMMVPVIFNNMARPGYWGTVLPG